MEGAKGSGRRQAGYAETITATESLIRSANNVSPQLNYSYATVANYELSATNQ
jgi:hypothetical protein